jgi:hypothetical protein
MLLQMLQLLLLLLRWEGRQRVAMHTEDRKEGDEQRRHSNNQGRK